MAEIPAFLFPALRFDDPCRESLRNVRDSEWETVFSDWRTVRLTLRLRQVCGDDLPDWVRSRIDTYLSDNALRFERIKQVYSTVATALSDANADHLVIKGFSLWPGYADHPRSRPQSDIDLYCPPESISRARDALTKLGYEPSIWQERLPKDHLCTMSPRSSWKWRGNHFDPEIPISFELHFCWWNESVMRFPIDGLEQFWARRVTRQLDDIPFPGLDPVDNLGYTSLNILRDLMRSIPAPEQVYGLARFMHTYAGDRSFWQRWRELHEPSLRRLEAVSFRLSSDWFGCELAEEVKEEMDRLPPAVQGWFREFSKAGLYPRFGQAKDGIWLHLDFLNSFKEKTRVLLTGLCAVGVPEFVSDNKSKKRQNIAKDNWGELPRSFAQIIAYVPWFVSRSAVRLAKFPPFFWHGFRIHLSAFSLRGQFWTFFAASFCFDFGMTMYFFLFNIYLLNRGFKAGFLGLMMSAMNVGTILCTVPAGILIHRLGIRKSLLLCISLLALASAARALLVPRSAILGLALICGFLTTIWAVSISPAIALLTDEKNRALGFSVVFSSGIGVGIVGNLAASRLPGLLMRISPVLTEIRAVQIVLLVATAIVALAIVPLSKLRIQAGPPPNERKLYPRNPFLLRFLPAIAVWSVVTGSLSPLANVYFAQYLHTPLERMGIIFSSSSLFQVLGILLAPLLFRKLGLVSGVAYTQLAAALLLGFLAVTSGAVPAALIYVVFTGFLWMSEPGMFSLLMDGVAPHERPGASALNFLVISLVQAGAVAATGLAFTRFGYPAVLGTTAVVALIAAASFSLLLGKRSLWTSKPALNHERSLSPGESKP